MSDRAITEEMADTNQYNHTDLDSVSNDDIATKRSIVPNEDTVVNKNVAGGATDSIPNELMIDEKSENDICHQVLDEGLVEFPEKNDTNNTFYESNRDEILETKKKKRGRPKGSKTINRKKKVKDKDDKLYYTAINGDISARNQYHPIDNQNIIADKESFMNKNSVAADDAHIAEEQHEDVSHQVADERIDKEHKKNDLIDTSHQMNGDEGATVRVKKRTFKKIGRPKGAKNKKSFIIKWTLQDKQRFITGLKKGRPFRKKNGNVNWRKLSSYIGTKTIAQVKQFAKRFNMLENGTVYGEFTRKAAVDVWKDVALKITSSNDTVAIESVPQVFTVAALEPITEAECPNAPNYSNIYNYLSSVLRGETNVPQLYSNDAAVILELLEDLIHTLSKSETLIQRQFMHEQYAAIRNSLNSDERELRSRQMKHGSTNPFGIPFDVLDFKIGNNDET